MRKARFDEWECVLVCEDSSKDPPDDPSEGRDTYDDNKSSGPWVYLRWHRPPAWVYPRPLLSSA
jgi:hypothetical protein